MGWVREWVEFRVQDVVDVGFGIGLRLGIGLSLGSTLFLKVKSTLPKAKSTLPMCEFTSLPVQARV